MQTACPVTCGLCPTSSTGSPTGGAGGDYSGSATGGAGSDDYGGSPTGGGGGDYGGSPTGVAAGSDAAGTNCWAYESELSQCTAANGCTLQGSACLQADAPLPRGSDEGRGGGRACVDAPDAGVSTATDNRITSCAAARADGACDDVRCLLPVEMYLALLASTQYSH
jgi:hypothetical protein